jgi:hypothetical protein
VAEGDGEGEAFSFLVVLLLLSFLVESVEDFLVVLVDDFLVVVSFFAGDFSGVVVVVSVLLVLQELRTPAANRQVIE